MTDLATSPLASSLDELHPVAVKPKLDTKHDPFTIIIFLVLLIAGVLYGAYSLYSDISTTEVAPTTYLPFILLGVALFIALAFEFVNGFHDTANAVATVI
ncbi:MAG TPA: inorganic phosphate transporter, partial [Alphaproteobacteria bacterium]|nr:inorganic phosphate transporter [Alphaproteobacteria bacterium]